MIKKILSFLGIALFLLIAVILFKTFTAKRWPVRATHIDLQPLPDSALRHLSQAVQIATISTSDTSSIDTAAFKAFDYFALPVLLGPQIIGSINYSFLRVRNGLVWSYVFHAVENLICFLPYII